MCHTSLTMSVLSSRTYRRDPSSPRRISKQNEKPIWFGHVPTHVLTHPTIKRRDKLSARHLFIDHVGCARLCVTVHGGYGRHLKQALLSRNLQSCLRVQWEMVPESAKDTISVNAQAPELGLIPAGSTFVGSNNPSWLDSILVESEDTEPKDREGWWHNKMEEKEIHILKTTLQHLVYQLCNRWSLRCFITPTQQNSISNSRNCAVEARAASSMQVFGAVEALPSSTGGFQDPHGGVSLGARQRQKEQSWACGGGFYDTHCFCLCCTGGLLVTWPRLTVRESSCMPQEEEQTHFGKQQHPLPYWAWLGRECEAQV